MHFTKLSKSGNFLECYRSVSYTHLDVYKRQDVNTLDPLEDKWKAFGWDVQSVDGHDIQQILYAIDNAKKEKGRPSMIILNTIKGKGVYFAENLVACHNMTITEEMWKKAVDMIDKEEI